MSNFLRKALQYLEYRQYFVGHRDAMLFRQFRNNLATSLEPQTVRVRPWGRRAVHIRPRSMDAVTLWDVLKNRFHLPPESLTCRTIVSLGANAGYATTDFACRYPQARIVAVEMDRENALQCERNTAFARDRVTVVNAAIWSTDGDVYYRGRDVHDLRISALDGDGAAPAVTDERRARAISIATLFAEHHLEHVDFLKMDIEGAEAAVFGGDAQWLRKVGAILVEVHPPATPALCQAVLEREGFRVSHHHLDHEAVFGIRPTAG
jgi:FkbM family methyltransferase